MNGVQELEEAADDWEDGVPESYLLGCSAVMRPLERFIVSHGLLSTSNEKSFATVKKNITYETSRKKRELKLHDVTSE